MKSIKSNVKMTTLTVRIDKQLLDEVKKKAETQGLAVSQVVRYYLKKYAQEKQLEFFF